MDYTKLFLQESKFPCEIMMLHPFYDDSDKNNSGYDW